MCNGCRHGLRHVAGTRPLQPNYPNSFVPINFHQTRYFFAAMDPKSCLVLLMLAFVNAVSLSLGPRPRPLVSLRQTDGAINASAFLRRAYHACKSTKPRGNTAVADREAAVLNGRLYIDGGEFSYQKGNDTFYEYCMKTIISCQSRN
jgi:hypothetical protein